MATKRRTAHQAAALVAHHTRYKGADSPEVQEARQNLAEARMREYIEKTVAKAPPLRPDQLDRLAVLLRSGQ